MHQREYGPRCCLHRPDESFRHSQQGGPLGESVQARGPLGDSVQAGVPDQPKNLLLLFHDDMTGQVLSDGEASEPFGISNGVKQGGAHFWETKSMQVSQEIQRLLKGQHKTHRNYPPRILSTALMTGLDSESSPDTPRTHLRRGATRRSRRPRKEE